MNKFLQKLQTKRDLIIIARILEFEKHRKAIKAISLPLHFG
jgi:hypothetical protein